MHKSNKSLQFSESLIALGRKSRGIQCRIEDGISSVNVTDSQETSVKVENDDNLKKESEFTEADGKMKEKYIDSEQKRIEDAGDFTIVMVSPS